MNAKQYVLEKKKELETYIPDFDNAKNIVKFVGQMAVPFSKLDRMCLVAPFSEVDWGMKYHNVAIPAAKLYLWGVLSYTLLK